MSLRLLIILGCLTFCDFVFAQKERNIWYFGNKAGLDFNTSPPTVLNNSQMNSVEACSSIADAQGNLLMYTDGETIWNKSHQVMANGSGLLGNSSSVQGALILKQPGNANMYYVFTLDDTYGPNGFRYNTVDMSLASGNGSVVAKNILLYTPCTERMAATRHCNGRDVWVMVHDTTDQFMAYLLGPTGVSPTPTISAVGFYYGSRGYMGSAKFSPGLNKLATATVGIDSIPGIYTGIVELFDFDSFTGLLSNQVVLKKGYMSARDSYGIEFSPASTKLYVSRGSTENWIYQWDLCAGSVGQIISSCYAVASPTVFPGMLQKAKDNRIYIANYLAGYLSAIHDPDMPGVLCNYQAQSMFLGNCTSLLGLPGYLEEPNFSPAITASVNCQKVVFNLEMDSIAFACHPPNFTYSWNFGDAASGVENFSGAKDPSHYYSNSGKFQIQLIISTGCISDTLRTAVTINKCTGFDNRIYGEEFTYENPSYGELNLKCSNPCNVLVYRYDGQVVWSQNFAAGEHKSDLRALSEGAYVLKIEENQGIRFYKIIIKK